MAKMQIEDIDMYTRTLLMDIGHTESVVELKQLDDVIKTLSSKEEQALRMSYGIGIDRKYKLVEIGQCLGFTRERARQVKKQALKKLRRPEPLRLISGQGPSDPLEISVIDLPMISLTRNVLIKANINTTMELTRKTEKELLNIHGLGIKGVDEIKRTLSAMGLELSILPGNAMVGRGHGVNKYLGLPIEYVPHLSPSKIAVFRKAGVYTVADLVTKSKKDILRLPTIGQKSLSKVEAILRNVGLSLRGRKILISSP